LLLVVTDVEDDEQPGAVIARPGDTALHWSNENSVEIEISDLLRVSYSIKDNRGEKRDENAFIAKATHFLDTQSCQNFKALKLLGSC